MTLPHSPAKPVNSALTAVESKDNAVRNQLCLVLLMAA
jgi:hypothetical protein